MKWNAELKAHEDVGIARGREKGTKTSRSDFTEINSFEIRLMFVKIL